MMRLIKESPPPDMLGYLGAITTSIGVGSLRTSWKIIEIQIGDENDPNNRDSGE